MLNVEWAPLNSTFNIQHSTFNIEHSPFLDLRMGQVAIPVTDLSVVIPTFDTAAMTLRCCGAVLASMPDSTEVIVADDGSSDGTADLLAREVPAVQVVRLESNRGFAAAANRGVAAARGRVIVLLNSDALVESGALRALLAACTDDGNAGVAGAQLLN